MRWDDTSDTINALKRLYCNRTSYDRHYLGKVVCFTRFKTRVTAQNFHLTFSSTVMADDMKFFIETDHEYSPTRRTKPVQKSTTAKMTPMRSLKVMSTST
jgi:hypothetical protein